jgi:hypothetical protein
VSEQAKQYVAKNKSKVRVSMKVAGMKGLLILGAGESSKALSQEQKDHIEAAYEKEHANYLEFSEAPADAPAHAGYEEPRAEAAKVETATNAEAQAMVDSGDAAPGPSVDVSARRKKK